MNIITKTKKVMTRDEVSSLSELIGSKSILLSKETNASTNKLKEDAWESVTVAYNAKCGSVPRTKGQLKLKWDNLKKAARKRTQQIRLNALKTGGGKPDFIPPDEILDKIASFLGSTCTGFAVPFGGDAAAGAEGAEDAEGAEGAREPSAVDDLLFEVELEPWDSPLQLEGRKRKSATDATPHTSCEAGEPSSSSTRFLYGVPIKAKAQEKSKKKKLEDARIQRDLNIGRYYQLKAEVLQLEIESRKINKDKETN